MRTYNKEGEPIPLVVAAELMEDRDYRRIDRTEINGYQVSTIWLGFDHSLLGNGLPLIFETMVFKSSELTDFESDRYSTLDEAKAGHQRICELVTKGAK